MKHLVLSFFYFVLLLFSGCSSKVSGDQFLGIWVMKSHSNRVLEVSRYTDTYLIREVQGRTWATISKDRKQLVYSNGDSNISMGGSFKLSDDGNRLIHDSWRVGELEYVRLSKDKEAKKLLERVEYLAGSTPLELLKQEIDRQENEVRACLGALENADSERHGEVEKREAILKVNQARLKMLKEEYFQTKQYFDKGAMR